MRSSARALVTCLAVLTAFAVLITGTAEASWFLSGRYQTSPPPDPAPDPTPDPPAVPEPPSGSVSYGGWARQWLQPQPEQPAPDPAPDPTPPAPGEPITHILGHRVPDGLPSLEAAMLQMVNRERTERGLHPLKSDPVLTALARLKAQDLVVNRYFAHHSPTFGSPFDMLRAAGVSYRRASENLSSAGNVYVSHYRLMNSDGHRRNILRSDLTHIGIGIVRNSSGVMVCQLFVGR